MWEMILLAQWGSEAVIWRREKDNIGTQVIESPLWAIGDPPYSESPGRHFRSYLRTLCWGARDLGSILFYIDWRFFPEVVFVWLFWISVLVSVYRLWTLMQAEEVLRKRWAWGDNHGNVQELVIRALVELQSKVRGIICCKSSDSSFYVKYKSEYLIK